MEEFILEYTLRDWEPEAEFVGEELKKVLDIIGLGQQETSFDWKLRDNFGVFTTELEKIYRLWWSNGNYWWTEDGWRWGGWWGKEELNRRGFKVSLFFVLFI